MGRRPTKNLNLPKGMRARAKAGGKVWYYLDTGGKPRREIPLGCDYTDAVRKWAELQGDAVQVPILTFKDVADRYMREVLPQKASRTQKDNLIELGWLLKFFGNPPAPLHGIRPEHIRQYLDWRGQAAKVRANREKALFSHIWNMARAWGITDQPNPCAGIKGFSESGRTIYIEDAILEAVWNAADQALRDAIDLAYLTGQRPSDVLAMRETDLRDGVLAVQQGKTQKKLRIEVTGALAALISAIQERKRGYRVHTLALICTDTGKALSPSGLRSRFDSARMAAAKMVPQLAAEIAAFQFRDLRAKAGTDKADKEGIEQAQRQLGHGSVLMTQHYVRERRGEKVSPTK